MPCMRFLSVGPRFCLQLPSAPASRECPCSLANDLELVVLSCTRSGLSPPSQCPCRANKNLPLRCKKLVALEPTPTRQSLINFILCAGTFCIIAIPELLYCNKISNFNFKISYICVLKIVDNRHSFGIIFSEHSINKL